MHLIIKEQLKKHIPKLRKHLVFSILTKVFFNGCPIKSPN